MFHPVRFQNNLVGHSTEESGLLYFFGTKNCTQDLLPTLYPNLKFCFLKQVHGADVIPASSTSAPTADGHFTRTHGEALVIQTADCLPILCGGSGVALGLHAGWRGLEQKIIGAAQAHGPFHRALVGPHIRAESFEVGDDIADRLTNGEGDGIVSRHADPRKRYVDLEKIARRQLRRFLGEALAIETLPGDTFQSPLYHSYRRGKERAARQYSFVALV